MTLDMTTFDAALKVHYTDDRVKNLVYKNNPLLAAMPKMESFGGRNLPIPIQYGIPGSRSATFTDALAQKGGASSAFKEFVLTRVKDYCLASIDNETLEASIGNPNAFMEAASNEINSAILSCTRSLATAMYLNGTGVLGTVAAGPAATSFTLATVDDVVNFEVGMTLVGTAGAAPWTVVATGVVTGVDRDTGVITHSVTAPPGGFTAGHFVACEGDIPAGAAAPNKKISGLGAWIPDAAPAPGVPFFTVDRDVDSSRLGGVRFAAGVLSKVDSLSQAAARLAREGGRPSHVFMNHADYGLLLSELNTAVQYTEIKAHDNGDISFSAMRLHTPSGTISVVPDHNCPPGRAYLLQMDTWKLYSLGAAPKILQTDGMRLLREASNDGVEVRVGYYAQLGCRAPGWNCVITGF